MASLIPLVSFFPEEVERKYFIYFLDTDWDEPLSNTLKKNLARAAIFASENNAKLISGIKNKAVFNEEVLSIHNILSQNDKSIFPSILITNINPHSVKWRNYHSQEEGETVLSLPYPFNSYQWILIPLQYLCKNESDVINVLDQVFLNIKHKLEVRDFSLHREIKNIKSKINPEIVEIFSGEFFKGDPQSRLGPHRIHGTSNSLKTLIPRHESNWGVNIIEDEKSKLRELLSENKIDQALKKIELLLPPSGLNKFTILKNQFADFKEKKLLGLISDEKQRLFQNNFIYTIINLYLIEDNGPFHFE